MVNFATHEGGQIGVELQDADGKPIGGFQFESCGKLKGDEIEQPVTWRSGAKLADLVRKPVRLRFVLKGADLFSIRFRN